MAEGGFEDGEELTIKEKEPTYSEPAPEPTVFKPTADIRKDVHKKSLRKVKKAV